MRTDTKILIQAMHILAEQIDSEDGVANAAIAEAGQRLEELYNLCKEVDDVLSLALRSHRLVKPIHEKAEAVLNKAKRIL